MKTAPKYYTGNSETVNAYQKADIEKLTDIFKAAAHAWEQEWIAQGKQDEGTCTGGKGIQIWFIAPRKRIAEPLTIVPFHVQGNVTAQKTVFAALDLLKSHGIEARYYDGWMD